MRFPFSLNSALAVAPLIVPRETPQERSHWRWAEIVHDMIYLNNTYSILDPVFGLLDNASAAGCQCTHLVADMNCLQLMTADSAFTNAKAFGNLEGMVAALVYRTLERNTNAVGAKSPLCTSYEPVNPELRPLTQHQDPASAGADVHNRGVVLELARQINAIGGDPALALEAGTFGPGRLGDISAKGQSCNFDDCIYEDNRLRELVTLEEIELYVDNCVPTVTITVTETLPAPTSTTDDGFSVEGSSTGQGRSSTNAPSLSITRPPQQSSTSSPQASHTSSTPPAQGNNLQRFSESLGDITAPSVTGSGGSFRVEGEPNPFNTLQAALERSCDRQGNLCADAANFAQRTGTATFSVTDCNEQLGRCKASVS